MPFRKVWEVLGFGDSDGDERVDFPEEIYEETDYASVKPDRPSNLIALKSDKVSVVVVEPTNFEEAPIIADNLKDRRPVIINMENADPVLVRRMIDFIGGISYAIGGTMQKIGYKIILVVPPNVNIAGELKEAYSQQDQEEVFAWVTQYDRED